MPPAPDERALAYHARTKHDFHRFAASLGFLDWATQPDPFRRFPGAPAVRLPFRAGRAEPPFDALFRRGGLRPAPLALESVGDFLRHALGLSAWKRHGSSRWSLRVNPSSGNLHPTEGWVVLPPLPGVAEQAVVGHHEAETHSLELRAQVAPEAFARLLGGAPPGAFLAALSTIAWREAWKYGERAFRYCEHDAGHALGALSLSAARLGWRVTRLTGWSTEDVARLLGLDRAADFEDDEPEEPELLALVHPDGAPVARLPEADAAALAAFASADWRGRANRLSPGHAADWPVIGQVTRATREPGEAEPSACAAAPPPADDVLPRRDEPAGRVLLRRRSAVDMDGRTALPLADFLRMMRRALPGPHAPWDALGHGPHVHLALFVHRVTGLRPGLYVLVRRPGALEELRAAMRPGLAWARPEPLPPDLPLHLLAEADCRDAARQVSCGQDIAADGAFSLGMLAEVAGPLAEHGPWFYRRLFQETGVIGQVLYLEAEAAGVRATGIGCFLDDAMHRLLGLAGPALQSLYHFTVGAALDDPRLTTEPGYPDEPP